MLEPSSVFYKLQAQLSTWDCKYILLENERQSLVYCRGHPDAFQSDVAFFLGSVLRECVVFHVDHGLRGSASPVLTATGFVNGRWQFSTPHRIHTP